MCRPTLQSSSLLLSAGLTFATSSGLNEGSGEFGHTFDESTNGKPMCAFKLT
jgi:hypothetical protein